MGISLGIVDPSIALSTIIKDTDKLNQQNVSTAKTIFCKKPAQFLLGVACVATSVAALAREIFVAILGIVPAVFKAGLHVVRLIAKKDLADKLYQALPGAQAAKDQCERITAKYLSLFASLAGTAMFFYKGAEWNVAWQAELGNYAKEPAKKSAPAVAPKVVNVTQTKKPAEALQSAAKVVAPPVTIASPAALVNPLVKPQAETPAPSVQNKKPEPVVQKSEPLADKKDEVFVPPPVGNGPPPPPPPPPAVSAPQLGRTRTTSEPGPLKSLLALKVAGSSNTAKDASQDLSSPRPLPIPPNAADTIEPAKPATRRKLNRKMRKSKQPGNNTVMVGALKNMRGSIMPGSLKLDSKQLDTLKRQEFLFTNGGFIFDGTTTVAKVKETSGVDFTKAAWDDTDELKVFVAEQFEGKALFAGSMVCHNNYLITILEMNKNEIGKVHVQEVYTVEGNITLEQIKHEIDIKFDAANKAKTAHELIFEKNKNRVPLAEQTFDFDNFSITVLQMEKNQVKKAFIKMNA